MLYCPNCQRLCKSRCPNCSDTRSLRTPKPDDPVFLFTANEFQRMMVEPVLDESGLPYWAVSQRGGALRAKLGAMDDTCRFYAPFASYEAVCQLLEDVFDDDGDILEALRSNRSFSKP